MTAHTSPRDLIPTLQRNAASVFAPLRRELNRIFDELGDGWNTFTEAHYAPRMDVTETKEGLEITLEAPGRDCEQVRITAEDDMLLISGEETPSKDKKEAAAHLSERSFGIFTRSLHLPRSMDGARATATMKNGVLKVDVPRRRGADVRTIEIQSK